MIIIPVSYLKSHFLIRAALFFILISLEIALMQNFSPAMAALPDTGQTKCYNDTSEIPIPCPQPGQDFYGQDAQYNSNLLYTKLDANGNALSDSATSWAMVKDNVTGLIWEIKNNTFDGVKDYDNPHDGDNTYTWYDPNAATNGGHAGTPGDGTDTQDFINSLNTAKFGGYSDWRLPTKKELGSIVDYGRYNPSINTGYFPNTTALSPYWSSSSKAGNAYDAWLGDFDYGDDGANHKLYKFFVRAVRGGSGESSSNLFINNDGTVTDKTTGLMWQQATGNNGVGMIWKTALAYCANLTLAGYTDWRLPNIKELDSLVDLNRDSLTINTEYFPDTKSDTYYWSSSTYPYPGYRNAWFVNFDVGYVATCNNYNNKSDSYYVRCVRGGAGASVNLIISGYVRDSGNNGIADITMSFSNNGGTVITDSYGFYSNAVSAGWTGEVIPSKSDYTFMSVSRPYNNLSTDHIDQNYTGTNNSRIINLTGDLAFGNVNVNTTKQLTFIIRNLEHSTLIVNSVSYPVGFSGNWNSGTIAAGDSQTVTVTFKPTAAQSYSGMITVNSDKTSGTDTIAISGIGATRIINLNGNLDFGSVQPFFIKQQTFAISNTGNAPLTISSIAYPVGFSGNWNSGTIAAGDSQTVFVTFAPISAKLYSGVVTINSDNTSGTNTIGISGTGMGAGTYTISGYIKDSSGNPGIGVTLTFSNGGGTATTDSSGYYAKIVSSDWSGTVTPSKGSYKFIPPTRSYSNLASYLTDQNYNYDYINKGKAIIVAGGGNYPSNALWKGTKINADYAYTTLMFQGYSPEKIYYLSADKNFTSPADGFASKENLQDVIVSWAADTDNLLIYMVDHGGDGTFVLNENEILKASELNGWLDTLQQTIPGEVILIYDACESGSVIGHLKPPTGKKRIIAVSASEKEPAVFASDGIISFSWFFWSQIRSGFSFYQSFANAQNSMELIRFQHSVIDADGNGIGNEKSDKELAATVRFGDETASGADFPNIGTVSPPQTLTDKTSALIYTENVIDADGIKKVWAVITPPDNINCFAADTPITSLSTVELKPLDNNRYEVIYTDFTAKGTYKIAIFATDSKDFTSIPETKHIIRNRFQNIFKCDKDDKNIFMTEFR